MFLLLLQPEVHPPSPLLSSRYGGLYVLAGSVTPGCPSTWPRVWWASSLPSSRWSSSSLDSWAPHLFWTSIFQWWVRRSGTNHAPRGARLLLPLHALGIADPTHYPFFICFSRVGWTPAAHSGFVNCVFLSNMPSLCFNCYVWPSLMYMHCLLFLNSISSSLQLPIHNKNN